MDPGQSQRLACVLGLWWKGGVWGLNIHIQSRFEKHGVRIEVAYTNLGKSPFTFAKKVFIYSFILQLIFYQAVEPSH